MKPIFSILLLSIFTFFSDGCQSQETNNQAAANNNFFSQIWQKMEVKNAENILILLDPHGESDRVLNMYSSLGKKYNTSLYASNKIYNNLPTATVFAYIDSLILSLGLNHKQIKITIAGFSGGAKYAQLYEASHPGIDRLILCGAISNTSDVDVPVLLFCGNHDMNYASMCCLQGSNFYHKIWDGPHAWPDVKTFELSFKDSTTWKKSCSVFSVSETKVLEQELALQKSYMDNYGSFSEADWNRILVHLSDATNNLVSARSKAILSMMSYLYTDHFIKAGQLEIAFKYNNRYLQIDPNNPDAYYLRALIAIKQNNMEQAKIAFNKALSLGWHETPDNLKSAALNF